ncbi:MAG: MarR family transcriptional regulator [Streptosporangiaceae bacterium]|jgi:DNA-binding MarR family transcriptional regulator
MANDARRPSGRLLPQAGELRVWREFIEAFEELRSEVASRLLAETALSAGDYVILLALSEAAGERLRSSQLAEAVAWERSRLSHHLGRMERRGLIRREECLADSRGAEVVLTTDGAAAFRHATVPHLRAVRELFVDAFAPDQLDTIASIASTLRAHLRSIN